MPEDRRDDRSWVDGAWYTTETAAKCGYHGTSATIDWVEADIATVYAYSQGPENDNYDGSDSYAAYRLKDGRYVYAHESSDSSGHG